MFRWLRLRKVHSRFLKAARSLHADDEYWKQAKRRRSFFELISPVPLLGLHEDGGQEMYSALQWLEANCRTRMLDVDVIRHYHKLVYVENPSGAGQYRKGDMVMRNNPLKPTPGAKVPVFMMHLDQKLKREQGEWDRMKKPCEEDLLKAAVEVHHRLGTIHPFEDANGRISRFAMNHLMRRYGGGYVVYPSLSASQEFWKTLQRSRSDNMEELVALARTCVYRI